jgi:hypothetical protein
MKLTFKNVREEGAKLDDRTLLEFVRALETASEIMYDNDMGYTSDVIDPVLTAYRMLGESRGMTFTPVHDGDDVTAKIGEGNDENE